MNTKICAVDCETTSLRPDRRAWEVGLILPDTAEWLSLPGHKPEVEPGRFQWFVDRDELDLGNADPFSLQIGKFYDRHPQFSAGPGYVATEVEMLRAVEYLTRGAYLIGSLPSFDVEVLGARMREHGIAPSWYYHPLDIEPLAIGYLHGTGRGEGLAPPFRSDDLSRAVGVEPPGDADRHTALGDADWCLRLWEAITGGTS